MVFYENYVKIFMKIFLQEDSFQINTPIYKYNNVFITY